MLLQEMVQEGSQAREGRDAEDDIVRLGLYVAKECNVRGWTVLTYSYFCQIPWPPHVSQTLNRKAAWSRFSSELGWISAGRRHKSKDGLIPKIRFVNSLDTVYTTAQATLLRADDEVAGTFRETFDVDRFVKGFASSPSRKYNAALLCEVLANHLRIQFPAKTGPQWENVAKDALAERASKLQAAEAMAGELEQY